MPADPESTNWMTSAVGALGLTSSALGAWVLRTSNRQERIEVKLEAATARLDSIDGNIAKIRAHITGVDL